MTDIKVIKNERKETRNSVQFDIIDNSNWENEIVGIIYKTREYGFNGSQEIYRVAFNAVDTSDQPDFLTIEGAINYATS